MEKLKTTEEMFQSTSNEKEVSNENKETIKDALDTEIKTTLRDYVEISRGFYASATERLIAFIIDLIITLAITSLFNTLTLNKLNVEFNTPFQYKLSYVIVMLFYFIGMTYYFNQTLGKMIVGIRVEGEKEVKVSLIDIIFRETIGRILCSVIFIPYITILFTKKKQGLHDYIANTVVVKDSFSKLRESINTEIMKSKERI